MARITKEGWFGPSATGSIFPMPKSWQGWLAYVVFIILLALTARLNGEPAWIARIGIIAVFLCLTYFAFDPE